jgi:hypothetical protein
MSGQDCEHRWIDCPPSENEVSRRICADCGEIEVTPRVIRYVTVPVKLGDRDE